MITDKQQVVILIIAFIVGIIFSAAYSPLIGLSILIIATLTAPAINRTVKVHR